jgi:two-component system LytT family sensor kinase
VWYPCIMKYRNLEIAVATIILLFVVYKLFGEVNTYVTGQYSEGAYGILRYKEKKLHFNFYLNNFLPVLINQLAIYCLFLWIACSYPHKFIVQQNWSKAAVAIITGLLIAWALFILKDCLYMPYIENILTKSAYRQLGVAAQITGVMLAYEGLKLLVIWLIGSETTKGAWQKSALLINIMWFVILWGISLLGVSVFEPYWGLWLFLAFIAPCVFLTYLVCFYYLVPKYYYRPEKGAFWIIIVLATLGINMPLNGFYTINMSYGSIDFVAKFLFGWAVQAVCIVPLSIYLHKIKMKRLAELTSLKSELGTSNAGLQFLRSQINPHFLFNALNTLYGTALTENAEKTGEGIQKLGDMMRFMLHENNQDEIALSREIDYLRNYIDLQNLRVVSSPNIKIEVQIEDIVGYHEIAPMLLIPFVENAYKHGISLKNNSWININLFKTGDTLNLDVRNSIHSEQENDLERYHSGTGLDNVKQRLQLLYPQKHALVTRKNTQEFFVHLSLTLSALSQQ